MNRSRKDCLGGQACAPATLPEALHCLIEHSAQDVTALAASLAARGIHAHRAYLYELANAQRADRGGKGLAIAAALTAVTGRAVLLRFLCRESGGEFVALPPVAAVVGQDEARLVAGALREFSEAMQAFADGSADGEWSREDVERLAREGRDAVERLLQLVAYARRAAGALPAKASKMAKAGRPVDPWLVAAGDR